MLQLLKQLLEDYKWVPEMLALAAAFSLLFKRMRMVTTYIFKGIWAFFSFPFRSQKYIKTISDNLESLTVTAESTARDIAALKEIIGYNGGSGLMDQVGFIIGYQASEFWMRGQPGFICDENGRNIDCTHGYCELLEISNRSDLQSAGWKSYTDREEIVEYIKEFQEIASRREIFRRDIKFYNSNGESVGTWLVIAQPISSSKAKTPRYMGFLYPFGQIAHEIAKEKGWPLAPPI